MKIHPIADEYPKMPEPEFQALKADIKERGPNYPITVDENGAILDGRHRYRACTELGIVVDQVVFSGTDEEKRQRVLSLNAHRRHLSATERNKAIANATKKATATRGTNQFAGKEEGTKVPSSDVKTISQAAKEAGCKPYEVKRRKYIDEHGIPELIQALDSDVVTKTRAWEISKLPKKEQRALAKKGFKADPKPRKVKAITPAEQEQPQQPVEEKPADPPPKAKLTHVERLEAFELMMQNEFKELRKLDDWSTTSERRAAVNRFLKSARNMVSLFERHAVVAAPDKTLFDEDVDIPEHLDTEEFKEAWKEWWVERKRRRKSVTKTVKKKQMKLLAIGDAEQATEIVLKAMENGWNGIPNKVWVPKYSDGQWCGRRPPNATGDLLKEINAAEEKLGITNGKIGTTMICGKSTRLNQKATPEILAMTSSQIRETVLER